MAVCGPSFLFSNPTAGCSCTPHAFPNTCTNSMSPRAARPACPVHPNLQPRAGPLLAWPLHPLSSLSSDNVSRTLGPELATVPGL